MIKNLPYLLAFVFLFISCNTTTKQLQKYSKYNQTDSLTILGKWYDYLDIEHNDTIKEKDAEAGFVLFTQNNKGICFNNDTSIWRTFNWTLKDSVLNVNYTNSDMVVPFGEKNVISFYKIDSNLVLKIKDLNEEFECHLKRRK